MTTTTHYDEFERGGASEQEGVLAAHLDLLLEGEPTFALQRTADPDTLDLMGLAAQLTHTLVPFEPDPAFILRLKADFVRDPATDRALALRWRALPPSYRWFAWVGGATLTTGIALLALRRAFGMLTGGRDRSEPESKPSTTN